MSDQLDKIVLEWVSNITTPPAEAKTLVAQYAKERGAFDKVEATIKKSQQQLARLQQEVLRREAAANVCGEMLRAIAEEQTKPNRKTRRTKKAKAKKGDKS